MQGCNARARQRGHAIAKDESQQSKSEDNMTLQPYAFPNDLPRRRTILLVEDEPLVREATPGGFSLCSPVSPVVMILVVNSRPAKPLPTRCILRRL
jgi:hypothetical protein